MASITVLSNGLHIRFAYKNHNGITEDRSVIVNRLELGVIDFLKEPQWLLRCYDPSRNADRTFALEDIDVQTVKSFGGVF